jgi:hypothetical protein
MPHFKKVKYDEIENKELYKKYMNEKYEVELLFNFYWNSIVKDPKIFENHSLIGKKLKSLSEEYFIVKNKEQTENKDIFNSKILYKNLIPLDISSDNYLFTKFIKFHINFVKFNQWYLPNEFAKLEVNEIIMKDFLTKELIQCLEKNKKKLEGSLETLSDFKLISNTCVKQRLSLFNFLIDFNIERKDAKDFINKMYLRVYRNKVYELNFSKELKDENMEKFVEGYSKNKKI